MRPVLDEACWAAFVAHANAHYRAAFLAALNGPLLRCIGRVSGAPCPHDTTVDLAAPDAANWLAHLHLDHEQDLQITCDMWKAALPPSPAAWDDGINGPLLCHLLFGVRNDPLHGAALWYASGAARWAWAAELAFVRRHTACFLPCTLMAAHTPRVPTLLSLIHI